MISFKMLKKICKYHTISYDENHDLESVCHSIANREDGESWGECNELDCPYWMMDEGGEENETN